VFRKNSYEELSNDPDIELYNGCIEIIEKDLNKWESKVRSSVFDKPNHLAKVIAYFYYHAMLKSIAIRLDMNIIDDFGEIGKECIMYFDKKTCIDDIVKISRLPEHKVVNVVNYLINDGKMNLLEFPLFEIEKSLVTIPSLILVNDWQFTIINGHYLKNIIISNRERTISTVTEKRIETALSGVTNVAVAKTVPYSFRDEVGNELISDIDYAIYDFTHNKVLIIEAKWIDKHYKDEIDKLYGKIFQTLNSIYTKQIYKHKKFLKKQENIDFLFSNDKNYKKGLPTPDIYYLAVDKRNQMHIADKHMVSEYMLIFLINKYVSGSQIDLEAMWTEISGLRTKVEYITASDDYYEINVGNEIVLVEQADLYWK
jgi:hypothetical protein